MSSPHILSQERIEATDESSIPICLLDPAAGFSIVSECFGINPLNREHQDTCSVRAEVGAVLADVGIRARTLGGSPKAVATGKPGFDRRGITPVPITGDGNPKPLGLQRADAGLGEVECPFLFNSHRGVKERAVTKAHRRRDMAEERHESLE